MQVLDFAAFPKPEFDLPIFCANFFTTAKMNIIVLYVSYCFTHFILFLIPF